MRMRLRKSPSQLHSEVCCGQNALFAQSGSRSVARGWAKLTQIADYADRSGSSPVITIPGVDAGFNISAVTGFKILAVKGRSL
jgi:hypothetical protein